MSADQFVAPNSAASSLPTSNLEPVAANQSRLRQLLQQVELSSLAAVFDIMPCGLSVAVGPLCREIIHNEASCRFFRVQPGERFSLTDPSSLPVAVFSRGSQLTESELPMQRAAKRGESTNGEEFEFVWPDGVRKVAMVSVAPMRNSEGNLIGALASIEDLTEQKQVEQQRDRLLLRLQEQHQILDGVTHHAPISLCIVNADLVVQWTNQAFLHCLRRPSPQSAVGERLDLMPPGTTCPAMIAAIQRVLLTGQREELNELRSEHGSDGPSFWNLTVMPFSYGDAQSKPHVLLATSDVTSGVLVRQELQRHRDQLASLVAERTAKLEATNQQLQQEMAERQLISEELQRSSRRVVDILESIDDAFLALDTSFNITYANEAAAKHYRRSREDLVGLNMSKLSPLFPNSEFRQRFSAALNDQQPVHFEAFGNLSYRWMSVHVYPTAEGLSVFFRDITSRRNNLAAASRLTAIVESSDAAIIYVNLAHDVEAWNPGAERMFGYAATEALGKRVTLICPADRMMELEQLIASITIGHKVADYEMTCEREDGSSLEVSMIISPVKNALGELVGKSLIINDISERKRLEREYLRLDRLNLAAQLAAGIGHEIRNPMTTVRGFLQFLAMKPKFDPEREFFQLMIDELDRANSIITEFLSLAKGKPVDRQMRSLAESVRQLAPLIQADIALGGHQLQLELGEVPDLLLEEKDIRQMLLNLVRNGVEAMTSPGQLTIRTHTTQNQVRLEVSDQGAGIPPEYLDKVYVPFFSTKDAGTGLGLSVCYRIADQHGARIEIDTSSQGTTFAVVFHRPNS